MTLAPNNPVQKEIGYRNTFDVSPWFEGKKIRPETGCGLPIILAYGEVQGTIIEGGRRSGFEHQGCSIGEWDPKECHAPDFWLYVDATNSDEANWDHGHYLRAGAVNYCVSMAHLAHLTCIKCTMTDAGKVTGCGERFELSK